MTSQVPASPASGGGFAPLRRPVFAVLWAGTIFGNVGSFMRDVASSWLVTDLSASPAAVAMIQAAGTLPIFLLAIPAGVLSDLLDRRRFLIGVQAFLACVSLSLAILSSSGLLTIEALVGLTFLGGVGAALVAPAWQSIVPELVPREELKRAVGLNSLGINIARSIGPAAGGLILAGVGAAATYGADVASYLFVIAALLWWKRPAVPRDELSESFGGAFRAGLRYVRASPEVHRVLLRAFVFFALASSVWALLPLVARNLLAGDAGFYGIMLGAIGAGAILGAVLMPRIQSCVDADGMVLLAALLTAAVMTLLCLAPPRWLALPLLLILGAAWIMALTTLNGTAQAVLPNWVRGRALAVYLTVFNGAMTAGSLAWGLVAQEIGVPTTLVVAAAGLVAAALVMHRAKLPKGEADLGASNHWPEPLVAETVAHDRGPVMITVEYRVASADRAAFLALLYRFSAERRRDGAFAWGVTEDAAEPDRLVEWFMVQSWAEHLRQHKRVSKADADVQAELRRFHTDAVEPQVRHLLALPSSR
ncbi:MFS transporter [Mangrovicella endophytica]|uniref:MFS transporter n=1 Tax=Mangrovicella endophytica TaxID=2066697 RepID=UPI000C9E4A7A|nr:MFS transporter [Mangrovicella endophytica]